MGELKLWLGLALLAAALALFWLASRQRRETGVPTGRIIYADPGGWLRAEKPLYDARTGLTGKPDYLVKQGDLIIPVEVKSIYAPPVPYDSHILQLAAYCHLVQAQYNVRPTHGLLRYNNRTLAIDYTPELETQLMETLAEMRACSASGRADRSHNAPRRCASCGFRKVCDQKLEN
jgi:CRISPR-associated exonuclease Cas4